VGALLALLSSVSWGTGDFLGGSLSRRAHPLVVMRDAQAIAFVGLVTVALFTRELDATGYLPWGVVAGLIGVISLGCFYAALAEGTMGVVAPVAAMGAVVPVAVGIAEGESPSGWQVVGIVVAVIGVVLASGPERAAGGLGKDQRRSLLMSGVAALGFGTALVLVAKGGEHSVIMTITTMRLVNAVVTTVLITVFLRSATHPTRADLPTLAVIAATDAGANGLYAIAANMSLLSVTAVFGSLYPAVTAVLAWRVHHEQLRRIQVVGVAATLLGVALLAGGG
jgi:drug/metabolite transporter (DMT)-like permease